MNDMNDAIYPEVHVPFGSTQRPKFPKNCPICGAGTKDSSPYARP